MIDIWNEIVENNTDHVALLKDAIKQTFGQEIQKWIQCCQILRESPFLMGTSRAPGWFC